MPPTVMSVSQAAEKLGLSVQRVRQLVSSGELPAQKLDRDWAIFKQDVAKFARRRGKRR